MIPKVIVISGCSSGIGYDAACSLKKRGHRVIATARQEKDLHHLLAEGLEVVPLDLTNDHSIATAVERILLQTSGRIDVLINNAGFGQVGALEDISRPVLREQFETNVFGLMELTRHVIPVMRQQQEGRIINISSILGLISMPFRGAYNASKYALEGLSDTLRLELAASKIKVITVNPGPIKSRFRYTALTYSLGKVSREDSFFVAHYESMRRFFETQKSHSFFTCKASVVSKKLCHAVEAHYPKARYYVTFAAYALAFAKRCLPTKLLDRLLSWLCKKEREISST